ncbi:MAG: hypothetical protein ACREJ2_10700, partial [Planctomycetota bacterium]
MTARRAHAAPPDQPAGAAWPERTARPARTEPPARPARPAWPTWPTPRAQTARGAHPSGRSRVAPRVCLALAALLLLFAGAPRLSAADLGERTPTLQEDWDAISSRRDEAVGRPNDYLARLLDIAARRPADPIADVALGVAEHLTRADTGAFDYPAALNQLHALEGRRQSQLDIVGWYLAGRLRARCYLRAGRYADALAAGGSLRNPGVSEIWSEVGPFGRHAAWAFDQPYPPEQDQLHTPLFQYAGADFKWHPLPLDPATGGFDPAAALDPRVGVCYLRSPNFCALPDDDPDTPEPVQMLIWSTGPWKLQVLGGSAADAPALTRDPGAARGAELRLFEVPLVKGRSYRLLVKLPAATADFNVLLLDPRTGRPHARIQTVLTPGHGANPVVRELPLPLETIYHAIHPGPLPGGALPDRNSLSTGDLIRLGIAAYAVGAYDQARYYFRPIARESAALEQWYLLSFQPGAPSFTPAPDAELLALAGDAARRDPTNVEAQIACIERLGKTGNRDQARTRLRWLAEAHPDLPDLAYLQARLNLDWDPHADIADLLARLPDFKPLPDTLDRPATLNRPGPADAPDTPDSHGNPTRFYRPKRRLALRAAQNTGDETHALDAITDLLNDAAQGHTLYCLSHPRDSNWPIGFACDPALAAAAADLYLAAGRPGEGYQALFQAYLPDGRPDPEFTPPHDCPAVAEAIWRLREALRQHAVDRVAADADADAAWQSLRALVPDSPRLWRQLGDDRARLDDSADGSSAYAVSFRLDDRQLDLLPNLPHFADRFGPPRATPPPAVAAAQPFVPKSADFQSNTLRRQVYLTYLPQGDCLADEIRDTWTVRT